MVETLCGALDTKDILSVSKWWTCDDRNTFFTEIPSLGIYIGNAGSKVFMKIIEDFGLKQYVGKKTIILGDRRVGEPLKAYNT